MKKLYRNTAMLTMILPACLLLQGCGPGGLGATPGGVQDMQSARALVQQGVVPSPSAFLPEGMLSEFDLPISGDVCTDALCLDAALGIAPDENGVASEWVQIGLSSGIDPDNFVRSSIATVYCIDVSGSMGWGSGENRPANIAADLLASITAQINAGDDVAIVTYGNTAMEHLSFTAGDDPAITNALNTLPAGGGTAMMAGLAKAYNVAAQYSGGADQVRVMLFTDEQPNIGSTEPGSFRDLVEANGFQGVGITIFGLGLGLNSELFSFMADVLGANAFSLSNVEQVPGFMDDNWPWFVSPIAKNLNIATTTTDVNFVKGYGFPGSGNTVEEAMNVATVFLSKNKGALILKFHTEGETSFAAGSGASLTIDYEDIDGTPHNNTLQAYYDGTPLDGNGYYMPEPSVLKAMALVTLVEGMRSSAEAYSFYNAGGDASPENIVAQDLAIGILSGVLTRFDSDALMINEPAYTAEADFWAQLLTLMQAGAPQGNLYGYDYSLLDRIPDNSSE
ncbi:MAG: VWA domain-containing protein [Pseudomonadales bacterium]|nr:VWA domain-containing protein [Pseudomonadales bacterium]